MGTLPGYPFKVGMDVYNWAEKKTVQMPYPGLRVFATHMLKFCKDHPYIGGFALLTAALSTGPFLLLIGFLILSNSCLLVGCAAIELLIIATSLSLFLPVLLCISSFSMVVTTMFGVLNYIINGGNFNSVRRKLNRKVNSAKQNMNEEASGFNAADVLSKMDAFESKMTQTSEWVVKSTKNEEVASNITEQGKTDFDQTVLTER